MKKILGIVLAFVMLVAVLAIIPAATDPVREDGYYVVLDHGITMVQVKNGIETEVPIAAKEFATKPIINGEQSKHSVHSYLTAHLDQGQPQFLEDLMIALLNYGAAAQEYFGVGGTLVGDPVDDTTDLENANPEDPDIINDGNYIGATLLLEGTLRLRFYFKGTDITATVDGKAAEAVNPEGTTYSYVQVDVMPYDMEKAVTVKVGGSSVTYAPVNYLKNMVNDESLSTMVASIYAYGKAAEAYVNHEHVYDGGAITLPATCYKEGVKTFTCSCRYSYTESISMLEHNYNSGVDTIPATCAPGVKTYSCTNANCTSFYTEATEAEYPHTYISKEESDAILCRYIDTFDGGNTYVMVDYCTKCMDWVSYGNYDNYGNDLSAAKTTLTNYKISGSITDMTKDSSYKSSWASKIESSPTKGEHPRLLVNSDVLAQIKSEIENGNGEMIDLLREVSYCADKFNSKGFGGNLGTANSPTYDRTGYPSSGTHNFNKDVLNSIMSKAFMYLYTGVDYYAVEATRWMKEYLESLEMNNKVNDVCRYYGYVMFATGIVYDWCHDSPYVTQDDRDDLVEGIETIAKGTYTVTEGFLPKTKYNMEVHFPPSEQGSVSGHGCEYQILRDYLAVSLAIYDEYPSWYQYVGGRIYSEYVPVRREFYESGMYPQGISVYIGIRFESDLWSAWLLQSATHYNPYEGYGQDQVIRSIFSRVVDGQYFFFDEGDDNREVGAWGQGELKRYVVSANISAYLYGDETAAAWASGSWAPAGTNKQNQTHKSAWEDNDNVWLFRLIYRSTNVDNTGSRHEDLDLILYNGGFMNEIVAHTDWTGNAASVLMKIGGYTVGNHDHGDAGSFQIYYKGILAGDTGFYDDYDSTHHNDYHQATIAHNSIVVYSGNKSYGQKTGLSTNDSMTYSVWNSGKENFSSLKTGTVLGYDYRYDARTGAPKYAYIAGDISAAYSDNSYAQGVERRMLSVFNTENPDVPMYFFVYDHVTVGKNTYQATFLLHTVNEPTISGNTVTVTSGGNGTSGGKLVLQSLIGGTPTKIGGSGKNYNVNGSQVATNEGDDGYWGRVEIKSPSGSTDQTMLNVMYVTDVSNNPNLKAETFPVGTVADGAAIGNSVAIFMKSSTRNESDLSFVAPNTNNGKKVFYYVSGMAAGTWNITCGDQVIKAEVDEASGLLVFNTYAGVEVKITKSSVSTGGGESSNNELPWDKISEEN